MEHLQKHKLYLKPEKCEFDQSEVEYLGVIVGNGKIRMDPVKIQGISEWPTPKCKCDLQSFLGFCNFYRRFIHHFAQIAHPLHYLTGNIPFNWTSKCQTTFDQLKTLITSAPILTMANHYDKFRLETDASEYAIGAILSQQQEDRWKPIVYLSKSLTLTERNYEIYDRELLAIMAALQHFRHYLMGAKQEFEIWTDHANLQYFKKPEKLNRRQARWLTELQEYDFTLHHIPGKSNSKADILSRRPGFKRGAEDNDNTILLPSSLFISRIIQLQPISFLPRIIQSRKNLDKSVITALERKDPNFKVLEDKSITYKDLIYVPLNRKLRGDIISYHHDTPLSGHYGQFKTVENVLRNYWWPAIHRDVKQYTSGCETCQCTKPRRTSAKTPLHPFEPPTQPWEVITVDLVGPLPESQGYNAILTIVDWFTKAVKFEPTHLELNSEGFARILRDRVIRDHGIPRRIIHDRDPRFISKYITDLFKLLGTEQNPSTAYHPQTDGQTECMNQTIKQYLCAFIGFCQDDWKEWLPLGEFSYNNSTHLATKQTPFFLNYGHHPWTGTDTHQEVRNESASQFADQMKKIREEASTALHQANDRTKERFDSRSRPTREYSPGDRVYLEVTNIKTN